MVRRFAWFRWAAFGLMVVLLSQAVATAQPGGPGGRRPGGGFPGGFGGFGGSGGGFGTIGKSMLLRSEQVQKELSIDEDQQKKIDEVVQASREKGREGFSGFSGLRELPEEERNKKLAEAREKMTAVAAELDKELGGILTDTQSKRLDQILLQQRGVSALQDEKVAADLGLSADQTQSLKDVFAAQREMMQELYSGLRDTPREEIREKFEALGVKSKELRDETDKAALEVLNNEQRTKFTELKGKEFELDRGELFQGFGRGRGGEGGTGGRRPGGDRTRTPQPGA